MLIIAAIGVMFSAFWTVLCAVQGRWIMAGGNLCAAIACTYVFASAVVWLPVF